MLYIIIGKDRVKTKNKLDELIAKFSSQVEKKEGQKVETVALNPENINQESTAAGAGIEQYLYNFGLFGEQYLVTGSDLLKDKTVAGILAEKFVVIAESPNIFVLREESIDATTKKVLAKFAKEIFEIKDSDAGAKRWPQTGEFNIFTMTDALGDKDRKTAWLTYVEAVSLGNEPEQIFGTLWWFVKNLLLVSGSSGDSGQAVTGLSPFVESKAKRALRNYNQSDISNMARYLVASYHDSRRGKCDLSVELEKFVLGKY